jgi:hypothetical protein
MTGTAFFVVAAIAFGAALIKAPAALRRRPVPGQRPLFILLLAVAASCFLLSDKVQEREDRLSHDLGRLLSNATTMIAAFAILALLITITYPLDQARPKLRRRLAALAVSVAGLTAMFALASPLPETLGDFGDLYRQRPALIIYIAIYIAFLGAALTELLVLAVRYARLARRRVFLRAGLLLMAAGGVLGLIYLAEKLVYVITQIANLPPPFASTDDRCSSLTSPPQCAFSITLPIAAVLLAAVGATLPLRGEALTSPWRRHQQARTFQALTPLWQALRDAFPQITLPEGPHRDLAFRLYRRVIEIDDGKLLLRPWLDPAVTDVATRAAMASGLRGDDLRATVEATEIAAALDAHAYGAPAITPLPAPAPSDVTDLPGEAAWLAAVATAFRSSPLVADRARLITRNNPS